MTATPAPTEVGRVGASWTRLVLLSFLMLFVELALIRWTGSNVVYLSYFSNFVLLGSFLGIGLGFLRGERRPDLWPLAPIAARRAHRVRALLPGQDQQRRRRVPLLRRAPHLGSAPPARPRHHLHRRRRGHGLHRPGRRADVREVPAVAGVQARPHRQRRRHRRLLVRCHSSGPRRSPGARWSSSSSSGSKRRGSPSPVCSRSSARSRSCSCSARRRSAREPAGRRITRSTRARRSRSRARCSST